MNRTIPLRTPLTTLALLLASLLAAPALHASHLDAAIQHADEASTAKDSVEISKHTGDAMNEIRAAAAAKEVPAAKAQEVIQAVGALQSADKNAHYYNTPSAAEKAEEAKAHLEAAKP